MTTDINLPNAATLSGEAYDLLVQYDDLISAHASRTDAGSAYDEALDEI